MRRLPYFTPLFCWTLPARVLVVKTNIAIVMRGEAVLCQGQLWLAQVVRNNPPNLSRVRLEQSLLRPARSERMSGWR